MNTLLVITLAVAIPVYALHWHNQPARTQTDKTTAIEAAFTFLFTHPGCCGLRLCCAFRGFEHPNEMANRKASRSRPDTDLTYYYDSRFLDKRTRDLPTG